MTVLDRFIVIDGEDGSPADIKEVGHVRRLSDPATRVWCVGFADGDGTVQRWLPGEPPPQAIVAAVADLRYMFVAHHAAYEITAWRHIWTPSYGWPEVPALERWSCTQARALALSMPAKLDLLARAAGLAFQKADNKAMLALARPRQPRIGEDPAKLYWNDDNLTLLQSLFEYCETDVEVERALHKWLPLLSTKEQAIWCLNERINNRGFFTDGYLIEKAIVVATAVAQAINKELQEITRDEINTIGQRDKLLAWLAARGCELKDFEKPTVAAALRRKELAPECRRILELRRAASHASAGKFAAMQRWRCLDGRIRGCFRFHGASTGRFSAHGVQPHNFKKEVDNIAAKFAAVMTGDIAEVEKLGAPIEIIGEISRAAICAPPGHRLIKIDYSGIESRVLAWLVYEQAKLDMWATYDHTQDPKDDPYFIIGKLLGFPDDVARKYGKIADLAFGFGGSIGAYRNFAPDDDTTGDDQIIAYRDAWRRRHPKTNRFWYDLGDNAVMAIRRAPEIIICGRLSLQCRRLNEAPFLYIKLPSSHELAYPYARTITNDRGHSRPRLWIIQSSTAAGRSTGPARGRGAAPSPKMSCKPSRAIGSRKRCSGRRRPAIPSSCMCTTRSSARCPVPPHDAKSLQKLVEQAPGWATDQPMATKMHSGPRFADVDVPAAFMPGSESAPRPVPKAKGKTLVNLDLDHLPAPQSLNDEAVRHMAVLAIEREAMRIRKEGGEPWPLTKDPIFLVGFFTNVSRAFDKGTRWNVAKIVLPYRDDPDLFLKIAIARFINNIEALAEINWRAPLDLTRVYNVLKARQKRGETVFRTQAYKYPMPPELKGMDALDCLFQYVLGPMYRDREQLRPRQGDTVQAVHNRLCRCHGVGGFLSAQIIADIKIVEPLNTASDWHTFVASGPGSRKGMSRLCRLPLNNSWNEALWKATLLQLRETLNPLLAPIGLQLDAQDVQHWLCEYDKYKRAEEAGGKPSRKYKSSDAQPAAPPKQKTTRAKGRTSEAGKAAGKVASEAAGEAPTAPAATTAPAADDKPNRDEAARFLALLDPAATGFTFQTFDDNKERKDPKLARILHGSLDQHFAALCQLNARGAGIFVTINETDFKGRTNKNIVAARRLFLDLDNGSAPPREPAPHVVVESSPGRWQVYWRARGIELAAFTPLQMTIAQRFGGDSAAKDRARVLRLPGFFHRKGAPVMVRIHAVNDDAPTCTAANFTAAPAYVDDEVLQPAARDAGAGKPSNLTSDLGLEAPLTEIAGALEVIPDDGTIADDREAYAYWIRVGIATSGASNGSAEGLALFDTWSKKSHRYNPSAVTDKWPTFHAHSAGAGSLIYLADETDPSWRDRYDAQIEAAILRANREASNEQQSTEQDRATGTGNGGDNNGGNRGGGGNGKDESDGSEPRRDNAQAEPVTTPVDLWAQFEPPPLPTHLLPAMIANFAVEQSALIGADPAGLAIAALTVCAAAIRDPIKLKVKRHGLWLESTRLWAALIGPVSAKKSPSLRAAAWPLIAIDDELCQNYAMAKQAWDALPADQRKLAPKPRQRRIRLEDITIEAVQEILRDSPDGVLSLHDELSGWFGGMDKYNSMRGAARDRGFWLQAYNGASYAVDRITRGSIFITNLSVSLLGSIQPDALRKIATDTVDDGLIQRIIPVMLRPAAVSQDAELPAATTSYNRLVRALHEMPYSSAPIVFDDAAMAICSRTMAKHQDLTACEVFNPKLAAHIGKYDGIFARLCLTWHCVESAERSSTVPDAIIGARTAQRVADFLHGFLLPHAVAFHSSVFGLSDEHDRLTAVAGYILAHKVDLLTNRVIQRGDRTMRGLKKHDIENVCHQLDALGWVNRIAGLRSDSPRWTVNPEVHRLFAERAAQEAERRQREREIIVAMFSARKKAAQQP
jgi:hypothetical protein